MKMHFLPNIKGPDDVKALSAEALSALVREIRAFLVEQVEKIRWYNSGNNYSTGS